MIKKLCEERYNFTYTILPLEAIFDADAKNLDMKIPTPEEKQKLEKEKKMDEENHTTQGEQFDSVKSKYVEIQDVEEKREKLKNLIKCLPIESSFQEDLIFYLKRLLISDYCLKFNFKKALLGTTSHKVASDLLG